MTGVTFPDAMRSRMMVRSSLFGLARTMTSFWLTNHDNTGAAIALTKGRIIHRPVGPPTATYIPVGFKTRLHADNE